MKFIGASVSVLALTVSAIACSGKLEVGEDPEAEATTEATAGSMSGITVGSASGGGSGGSASAATCWVDEVTPVPAVSGSSEGCPAGPVCPDSPCETEGLSCQYYYEPSNQEQCYCVRTWDDRQTWACFHGSGGEGCPSVVPEQGSDCYGYFGLTCLYPPERECSCDSTSETWNCPTPTPVEPADPPELLDPERLVAELTDEERETWCEWYSSLFSEGPGFPPVADRPVENGYASGPACTQSFVFCHAAVPTLSKAQCIANLSLSECMSPVSHLTGCAIDMLSECGPFDYSCLDYLETPNCDGTMVLRAEQRVSCDVRVESN